MAPGGRRPSTELSKVVPSAEGRVSPGRVSPGPGVDGNKGNKGQPARKISILGQKAQKATDLLSPKSQWRNRVVSLCQQICNNTRFQILTTGLTLYALFGDDLRLAAFSQSADMAFNLITITSIAIFSFEIVVSSIGQEEYFRGFFFYLDLGSTVTLLLDLTWVGEAAFCTTSTSRSGKTAAKALRTVRIIRLLRLVKLYKAYTRQVELRKALAKELEKERLKAEGGGEEVAPGEEDDDKEFVVGRNESQGQEDLKQSGQDEAEGEAAAAAAPAAPGGEKETRVGKKLGDMTTRRVIMLVLVMLFMMPLFSPTQYGMDDFTNSAEYGSEMVYRSLRTWCLLNASDTPPWCLSGSVGSMEEIMNPANDSSYQAHSAARDAFEATLLRFAYHHHIGETFPWRLFWMGFNSTSLASDARLGSVKGARAYLGQMAKLSNASIDGWDARFVNSEWRSHAIPLSAPIKESLTYPWKQQCLDYVGLPLQPDVVTELEADCSITQTLRCTEVEYIVPLTHSKEEISHVSILFAFDTRSTQQLESTLNMLQTIFICIAVGAGAMTFTNDANTLLLNPIERMIAKMENIKDNPLEAMKLGDLEYRREEIEATKRQENLAQMHWFKQFFYKHFHSSKTKEPMETVMLEKTIIKLGGLLALGFGEAGAEVIGQNLMGGTSSGLNAMLPGEMVDVIVGVCNIRHFLSATEVLKEKVMLFANTVGEIVHGCVDDYHGAPNRSMGESFLLVWRLSGNDAERQTKLADMAIVSFAKIVAEVNKSRVLEKYRKHPGLLQRVRNFRVSLGFGMHCGWAIEGAIGSEVKIDAAYLSPNMAVASKLQRATMQYGVFMLISHEMVNLCSHEMALMCRLIDHVFVKGMRSPIRLYTIDLDCMALAVVREAPNLITRNRFKIRQLRELRKADKWAEEYSVSHQFEVDPDLLQMRAKYSPEFFHRFSMAYRNYEAGEWMAARDMLFTCHYTPKAKAGRFMAQSQDEWPEDGPTWKLLNFMSHMDFEPPQGWAGFHALEEY